MAALAMLGVQAHEGADHAHPAPAQAVAPRAATVVVDGAAGREAAARLPDASLFVPKALQRQLGLRTSLAEQAKLGRTLELSGRVVADPAAGGRLQATQDGVVMGHAQGFPVPGQRVRRGQLLMTLQPRLSSLERAAQQAELAELGARLVLARAQAERLAGLEGSVAGKEIQAARVERDALAARLDTLRAALTDSQPLKASADGVVGAVHVAAGDVVEARELLLEIVDPKRLAVEALVYDPTEAAAIVAVAGQAGQARLKLEPLGSGMMLRGQALPLLMRVRHADAPIAIGQPVTVWARTAASDEGVMLPRSALALDAGGQTVVWVHTQAERFEPRRLTHRPLDADRIMVTAGVKPGERVVSQGATLLTQIR